MSPMGHRSGRWLWGVLGGGGLALGIVAAVVLLRERGDAERKREGGEPSAEVGEMVDRIVSLRKRLNEVGQERNITAEQISKIKQKAQESDPEIVAMESAFLDRRKLLGEKLNALPGMPERTERLTALNAEMLKGTKEAEDLGERYSKAAKATRIGDAEVLRAIQARLNSPNRQTRLHAQREAYGPARNLYLRAKHFEEVDPEALKKRIVELELKLERVASEIGQLNREMEGIKAAARVENPGIRSLTAELSQEKVILYVGKLNELPEVVPLRRKEEDLLAESRKINQEVADLQKRLNRSAGYEG